MPTWLFEANPDRFDIDGYLANVREITWTVNQSSLAPRMAVGDRVYLWRASGRQGATAGVVAEAQIIDPPKVRPEQLDARPYWKEGVPGEALRVLLHVIRVANDRQVIKRDFLKRDPVLSELMILRLRNLTNYELPAEQADRLTTLWNSAWSATSRSESTLGRMPTRVLTTVTDRTEIKAARDCLATALRRGAVDRGTVSVGFRGGQVRARVYWNPELALWMCFEEEKNRFWNAFGLEEPSKVQPLSIIVEINFPYTGIDRRIGAAFAHDEAGELYLVHRGKLGGGRAGVSKTEFMRSYRGLLEQVEDGGRISSLIVIGPLSDPLLPAHVADFVRMVHDFKKGNVASSGDDQANTSAFSPEFSGTKSYRTLDRIVANCSHGAVVNSLERLLRDRGYQTRNDPLRDLYVLDASGQPKILFEAKSSADPYSIYTAIGQLMFHSQAQGSARRVELTR